MALNADPRRPEIPALTSLRFVAALWVVAFHIREIGLWRGGPAPYIAVAQLGYLGVSFFFVLSGFILVYVYSGREIARGRFWQARFARIYPAYLVSLVLTLPALLYSLPQMRRLHLTAVTVAAYPLLLEAWFPQILLFWNAVAWSLSAEAFFYLLFPFAMHRLEQLTPRTLQLWIGLSFLASLVFTVGYVLLRPDGVAHTTTLDNQLFWLGVIKLNPVVRLPEFLLGMGAGALFRRLPARPRLWPVAAGLLLLLTCVVLQAHLPYPVMHSGLLAPAFALVIFGIATLPSTRNVATRLLATRPLILLGEASYSLYLLHTMPIAILAFGFHLSGSPHMAAILAGYLLGICLLSIAVFRFIESPLRLRLRPHRRIAAAPAPLAAVR